VRRMNTLKGFPKRYEDAPEAVGDDWWGHYRLALYLSYAAANAGLIWAERSR